MTQKFIYDMNYTFSSPIKNHSYRLKCVPRDTDRQKIIGMTMRIEPVNKFSSGVDSYGNMVVYGRIPEEHTYFRVMISGEAETGLAPQEEYDDSANQKDLYRSFSDYTKPGPRIKELYKKYKSSKSDYAVALDFMYAVNKEIRYEKGVTDVKTTAEEAACLKAGVCQDYSHILLSMLRLHGIPARYVVGMIEGEGESHAWVEVCCDGYWYGLDCTNKLLVGDGYIKISHGRDYADCSISRGVFDNVTNQTTAIDVIVEQQ